MSTDLFVVNTASDIAGNSLISIGTRGSGVVSAASSTIPSAFGNLLVTFVTPPLDAVTLTNGSTVTYNLWGSESAMTMNAGPEIDLDVLNPDGSVKTHIISSQEGVEFGTSSSAHNWTTALGTSYVIARGDRLSIAIGYCQSGGAGAAGTCTLRYNGTSAAADGDSWVRFVDTIVEMVPQPPRFGAVARQAAATAANW